MSLRNAFRTVALPAVLGMLMLADSASATTYSVQAWGFNRLGMLGESVPSCGESEGYRGKPGPVGLSGVKSIAVGTNDIDHAVALTGSGKVETWGSNIRGELGDEVPATGPDTSCAPTIVYSKSPKPIATPKAKAVAAGANDGFAILGNGSVMGWGQNGDGELGNGLNGAKAPEECPPGSGNGCSSKPMPVCAVGASPPCSEGNGNILKEVVAIAAGNETTLALLKNGTVVGWGVPSEGELGGAGASYVPIVLPFLKEVKAIASGSEGSEFALLKNGTIESWGFNSSGDLGQGSAAPGSAAPALVKLPAKDKAKAIAASRRWAMAALTDGTAVAWGGGPLGNGEAFAESDVPVAVSGLKYVWKIAAGEVGLAITKHETVTTVWSWGESHGVLLGTGDCEPPNEYCYYDSALTPVEVTGLKGAVAIGVGSEAALALK